MDSSQCDDAPSSPRPSTPSQAAAAPQCPPFPTHDPPNLYNLSRNWPPDIPTVPKRIDVPMYIASLTPRERDAILDKHLEDYKAISDEAQITDFELLQAIHSLSIPNQIPEDRLPPALSSENVQPYHPAYFVGGPLPRLAQILRLRMLEDKLLHLRLQQAKLTVSTLELQADGCKERVDSAHAQWEEAVRKFEQSESSSSTTSYRLPLYYQVIHSSNSLPSFHNIDKQTH